MPKAGFKSVTVTQDTYQLASQIAGQEQTSITQVLAQAVQRYLSRRIDDERIVKLAVQAVKQVEASK